MVVNNKIVEEWIIRDEASILCQLGFKVSDFVEQRIDDGTFKKNDVETTKNSFIQKNIMSDCENIYAKKYKDSIIDLIEDKFSFEKKVYERSAQLYWFGGELINTVENIYEKWNLFLSCFKILKCEVSNSIALDQNNMRPRAAMRWRLICLHNSNGLFGLPTNKEIEIYGISHAEFGKQGIVREFILIDEISIWKQLLL